MIEIKGEDREKEGGGRLCRDSLQRLGKITVAVDFHRSLGALASIFETFSIDLRQT